MGNVTSAIEWYEWLAHTNFSFLVGASHPEDMLRAAITHGYRGIGIADYDGVYGLARTHRRLAQFRKKPGTDLRLFYGAEIHLDKDHERPLLYQNTLVLYAMSRTGYANLCRILSFAHRESKTAACISLEELSQHDTTDLASLVPMRGLLRWQQTAFRQQTQRLRDLFGDRLYMLISRHLHPAEDQWINEALSVAQTIAAPILLSQDAYFHSPKQKDLSDLLHSVRTNLTLDSAAAHFFPNGERSLHKLQHLERIYGELPFAKAALTASRELAERCQFDFTELRYQYPKEMIPEGFSPQAYLEHLTWQAAEKLYGKPVPGRIATLLHHELRLISQLNFADYFLTVWDIVRWARERDILCQGRGSAANSAVCFVLGVTAVDPSMFDLLFERFISAERGDPPDIDVDFEHERREEVIQYIYERYGRGRAAMVANVITFRSKGAVRAVGKALGVAEDLLGEAASALRKRAMRGRKPSESLQVIRDAVTQQGVVSREKVTVVSEPIEDDSDTDPRLDNIPWEVWGRFATRLKGFPRHLGIHSGGFMLADQPLDNLVAQEPATMEGRTVVQWCKEDIEGLGFFKIDILALGMLTAIRKSFQLIKDNYQQQFSLATIPADDKSTYAMIQRADTVGTFQVESRAQMSMLPRLRPNNFYDMVIEVAIIRPGPIQGGMIHPFLRRRNGLDPIVFPDERLRPILARTMGVPIFQEQVMRVAMAVGGFSGGEANELRRHMGAWSIKGDMGPWLRKLEVGMRANGISEEFIKQILGQMRGFADYGFPESHAVSFALLAYASCYLKCHFPGAFFTSVLNSQPMGFYSPHALLQAAMRSNVPILPVSINHSDWDHQLEAVENYPGAFAIRLGFRLVTSLSEGAGRLVAQVRKKQNPETNRWDRLSSCLKDIQLYRNDLTALAAADAFHVFGIDRRAALWLAEAAPLCPHLEDEEDPIEFPVESPMLRVEMDFASTQTTLGPHPTALIRDNYWCYSEPSKNVRLARDFANIRHGELASAFGMVLVRQAPPSAKGMMFVTLEDDSGYVNLVFTPQTYERFHALIDGQAFLCVRGKTQKSGESHSLLVLQMFEPQVSKAEIIELEARYSSTPLTAKELQPTRNYM